MRGAGTEKEAFPLAVGQRVAAEMVAALREACVAVQAAGSVRRRRPHVRDIEVLYVPKVELRPRGGDLFGHPDPRDLADEALDSLLSRGALEKRRNVKGALAWGAKIKLARHVATGIPVDLFATTEASWHNYLVCRTGPAESNVRIAAAARKRGWKWRPYSDGFVRLDGRERKRVHSEREVFEFVGLPYREPEDRG